VFLTVAFVATADASQADELEIRASLSGYNLLWPTSRCCAFDLHVLADGHATVEIHVGATRSAGEANARRTSRFRLSPTEIDALRSAIEKAEFFAIPEQVGVRPVDGDERRMEIRVGDRSHRVLLTGWGMSPSGGDHPEATERARSLWTALRLLVKDPEVTLP
jgi:hypothetical protein